MSLIEAIEKITQKISPGPLPHFNEAHVVKSINIIGNNKNIGRIRLSKALSLGEGQTRTLLKHLKNEGIILSSRKGIIFSENGKKLFSKLNELIKIFLEVPSSKLTLGPYNTAVLVKNSGKNVKSGMEQRDIAIKSGASGATTLVFSQNKLSLPTGEENLSKSMPELHNWLITKMNPYENDVIIIGCGENKNLAEIGATMAAIKLLKKE